jgi:hypothetical protein
MPMTHYYAHFPLFVTRHSAFAHRTVLTHMDYSTLLPYPTTFFEYDEFPFVEAQGRSAAGRIMSMKNSNDTNGIRFRDLPVCSAVPQPLRHRVPPLRYIVKNNPKYLENYTETQTHTVN